MNEFNDPRIRARTRARSWVRAARNLARGTVSLNQLAFGREMSMSQFGEDAVLAELFHDQNMGFYVDVGALHPFAGSNTYNLYRRGWRGMNLEPVPSYRALFEHFRPHDINLPYAAGAETSTADFVVNGSFSSFVGSGVVSGRGHPVITVPVRRLEDIFGENLPSGQTIDLLDVDCEGADAVVLASNDWERYRPRVVLAERHGGPSDDGEDPFALLEARGYEQYCVLRLTGIFVDAAS